jgi:hypothetical protein
VQKLNRSSVNSEGIMTKGMGSQSVFGQAYSKHVHPTFSTAELSLICDLCFVSGASNSSDISKSKTSYTCPYSRTEGVASAN